MNNEEPIPLGKRKFCLPFAHYVDDFFGIHDSRILDHETQYKATLFASIDTGRAFVHVEWPTEENKLKFPRIWRIAAWLISEEKWNKDKARSEAQRIAWCKYQENIERMLRALHIFNGLSDEENLPDADRIAKQKNTKAAKWFGVELDL